MQWFAIFSDEITIKRSYDTLARTKHVTSYSGNNGTGSVLNELNNYRLEAGRFG